jgi:hypothetical protein
MSSLTLFAAPKPFSDPHIATIQRNAIRSWLELKPQPQIILFGNEPGIAEAAADCGVQHVPDIKRNELGTPLVSDVFSKAESQVDSRILCYVNADIILLQDFCNVVKLASRFLLGGRPWNIRVQSPLDFEGDWRSDLQEEVASTGELRTIAACDYFVYTRGLWPSLPPLLLGRMAFDSALLYKARKSGAPLVDATAGILAIHQHHSYPAGLGGPERGVHPEVKHNVRIAGGTLALATWMSATHKVRETEIRRHWLGALPYWFPTFHITRSIQQRFWFPILALTKPVRRNLGLLLRSRQR